MNASDYDNLLFRRDIHESVWKGSQPYSANLPALTYDLVLIRITLDCFERMPDRINEIRAKALYLRVIPSCGFRDLGFGLGFDDEPETHL